MLTIENKFELNQIVYARRVDNAVVVGDLCMIRALVSSDNKTPSVQYTIQFTNGKNARSEVFDESQIFSTAEEAFKVA